LGLRSNITTNQQAIVAAALAALFRRVPVFA
jgi:hypothetical protein